MLRRQRTTRRRGNSGPSAFLLSTGALTLLLAVALLYVAFRAPTRIPLKPYYDVQAQFTSLGTLSQGANVSIAGNRVGEAINLRLVKGIPTVDLELDTSTPKLPVDTIARIRPRGLLGAEYVDLVPGHSQQTISDGGMISVRRTSQAEQLSDVLAALDAPTRTRLGDMLRGLGEGVAGRGPQINETLADAPVIVRNLTAALGPTVRNSGAVPRLVAGGDSLTAALDPVRDVMVQGFAAGTTALQPFVQERPSVSQLLQQAPTELAQVRESLTTIDPVLGHVTRFADAATRFTALAPNALHSLTAVLVKGRPALRNATVVLKATQPAIDPTLALTKALHPELPHLNRLFVTVGPQLAELGRYGCDLEGFAHNWRGFLGLGSTVQSGPLGPFTALRTELSGSLAAVPDLSTTLVSQTASEAPCVKVSGS